MIKKPSTKVIRVEKSSSPGLNTKKNFVKNARQESQNSNISTDQNIFINEDYHEEWFTTTSLKFTG
jgi:hypothetical protein